jgi:hypothetical protein
MKMFNPPKKIKILGDNNELMYIKTIPKNKSNPETFMYRYTVSVFSKDKEIGFTEESLKKQLNNYFIEI